MTDITNKHEAEILNILKNVTSEQKAQDPQYGLYLVWDYLEENNISTHKLAEFMEKKGDFLVHKALLAEIVNL